MGLQRNNDKRIYVNIKDGKLYVKPKDSEPQFFDSLSGSISKVDFTIEEYNGTKYERVTFTIIDGEEKFLLQMRVDSGYFRGLVNSLRSGNPTDKITISPFYKEENNRKQSTFFVYQNGKTLKHFFTRDNQGDLPQLERVQFKGQDMWDGSKQIEYWKNWLLSLNFEHELLSSYGSSPLNTEQNLDSVDEIESDLPF